MQISLWASGSTVYAGGIISGQKKTVISCSFDTEELLVSMLLVMDGAFWWMGGHWPSGKYIKTKDATHRGPMSPVHWRNWCIYMCYSNMIVTMSCNIWQMHWKVDTTKCQTKTETVTRKRWQKAQLHKKEMKLGPRRGRGRGRKASVQREAPAKENAVLNHMYTIMKMYKGGGRLLPDQGIMLLFCH